MFLSSKLEPKFFSNKANTQLFLDVLPMLYSTSLSPRVLTAEVVTCFNNLNSWSSRSGVISVGFALVFFFSCLKPYV